VGGALVTEVRHSVVSFARSPSLQVPFHVWSGVAVLFSTLLSLLSLAVLVMMGAVAGAMSGLAGAMGAGEGPPGAWWVIANLLVGTLGLAWSLAEVFGLFTLKKWAYGLFVWGVVAMVSADFFLWMTCPKVMADAPFPTASGKILIATFLVALAQYQLVVRSRDELVA